MLFGPTPTLPLGATGWSMAVVPPTVQAVLQAVVPPATNRHLSVDLRAQALQVLQLHGLHIRRPRRHSVSPAPLLTPRGVHLAGRRFLLSPTAPRRRLHKRTRASRPSSYTAGCVGLVRGTRLTRPRPSPSLRTSCWITPASRLAFRPTLSLFKNRRLHCHRHPPLAPPRPRPPAKPILTASSLSPPHRNTSLPS